MGVSQTVIDDLDSFEECSLGILKNVPLWDLYDGFFFSHDNIEALGSWEKTTQIECHFHHMISKHKLSTRFMTVDVGIDHLAKVVLVRSLHCNSYSSFPSPFPFCLLHKEVTVCSPHQRSGELCSPSLKVVYLHKLLGIFLCGRFDSYFPFINVFSHLFITLCVHEYLFYFGGCNSIPLYLFCYSNYSNFAHWELFQLGSVSPFFTCFKLVLIFWPYNRLQIHLVHMLFIGENIWSPAVVPLKRFVLNL